LAPIIDSISGMFRRKGVKANRKKTNISTGGRAMTIHNLNINADIPTIPQKKRKQTRAAEKEVEEVYRKDNQSSEYKKLWRSTLGRVNYLRHLHPHQYQSYLERLEAVRPPSDPSA